METKPTNAICDHDWTPSLEEAGVDVCAWPSCGETREAPAGADDDVHVVSLAVEYQRSAA
jgi:hypothetical protein